MPRGARSGYGITPSHKSWTKRTAHATARASGFTGARLGMTASPEYVPKLKQGRAAWLPPAQAAGAKGESDVDTRQFRPSLGTVSSQPNPEERDKWVSPLTAGNAKKHPPQDESRRVS